MLAELASAKACDQIRNNFQALPAAGRDNVMSGVLWIHTCRITNTGTKVTFHLEGHGWQWIDEEKKKGGGTFSVHQYVRFGLVATITGTLLTLWRGSTLGSVALRSLFAPGPAERSLCRRTRLGP